ncbi:24673_t:CDS:2 [Cetraspora pellucida]|uniref:24673_t:CDS:1 n=1 Tax=Cetraspora pellucida TaxID=1433469 RepID=A0A9N8VSZ2_9GLOM|nr:24673_t:CDS:2 [Cetraspora pellucida]
MLHQIAVNTSIIFVNCKITNHNARQTAIMLLKASDIPKDELIVFSDYQSHKDLKEYYNYSGEFYIIYESEENNLNAETTISNSDLRMLEHKVTATSNNSIINDSSQYKLSKPCKIIKQSKSRLTIFTSFKLLVKKTKISNSKSNLQQN